jgi:ATP-dependent helicase YprA (DUF1998 family)
MKTLFAFVLMSALFTTVGLPAESARTLSKKEVKELIAKAATPAEHNKLAQYYRQKAENLEAEADEHADLAKAYHAQPNVSEVKRPMSPDTAEHCEYLAESLRKAAAEARALAAAHAQMAKK